MPRRRPRSHAGPALRPFARFFADPIYRQSYIVTCCRRAQFLPTVTKILRTTDLTAADRESVLAALQGSGPDGAERRLDGARGVTFRLSPTSSDGADVLPIVVIWLEVGSDIAVLVHEAWHALFWVFSKRGVQFDDGGGADEPVSYYLEWIVRSALRR